VILSQYLYTRQNIPEKPGNRNDHPIYIGRSVEKKKEKSRNPLTTVLNFLSPMIIIYSTPQRHSRKLMLNVLCYNNIPDERAFNILRTTMCDIVSTTYAVHNTHMIRY